jgi:TPR repeat protein
MTATFDPNLGDDVSRVRQTIGDTVTTAAQIQDETITAYLATPWSVLQTSHRLAMDLAAKWSAHGDVTVDDQLQRASKIAEHYWKLAAELKRQLPTQTATSAAFSNIMVTGVGDPRGPLDDCPESCYDVPQCC